MKKFIEFSGVTFRVLTNEREISSSVSRYLEYKHRSLWDCYVKPSERKGRIWGFWNDFCYLESDCVTMPTVVSYNCNFFSVAFEFNFQGARWLAWVTPRHNYAFPM